MPATPIFRYAIFYARESILRAAARAARYVLLLMLAGGAMPAADYRESVRRSPTVEFTMAPYLLYAHILRARRPLPMSLIPRYSMKTFAIRRLICHRRTRSRMHTAIIRTQVQATSTKNQVRYPLIPNSVAHEQRCREPDPHIVKGRQQVQTGE